MSEEQLKAFLEKVKSNTELQDKLKAAADADAVLAIAKEAGFTIDALEFQSKIEDAQLESAAGGIFGNFTQGGKGTCAWTCFC